MALRERLEAGDLDEHEVRRRVAETACALLGRYARDLELVHVTRALAARGFLPAPPATLPVGSPAEVRRALAARTPEERQALAAALVVLPDAASEPEAALAAVALLVTVPGEEARAEALLAALAGRGEDVSLERFELALARLPDPTGDALEAWESALAEVSADKLDEAKRRAAASAIERWREAPGAPHGIGWLVPCRQGSSVANWPLALGRRPRLAAELGPVAGWLVARDPALETLHERDRTARGAADWERGTEIAQALLDGDDRRRVVAARHALTEGAGGRREPLPHAARTALGGVAERLARLGQRDPAIEGSRSTERPSTGIEAGDAEALELLGDMGAAARAWLGYGLAHDDTAALVRAASLAHHLGPAERAALGEKLATEATADETRFGDPEVRVRAAALDALEPDPWYPVRLATIEQPEPPAARREVIAAPAPPTDDDPHHPENRLAAASDLLAADRLEPASNILASLVRRVDEHAPARLFGVVAQALEADEPMTDLIQAAERALTDARATVPLLEALRKSPSAAFVLHEGLIAFALDPSRAAAERLLALEVWLGIWAATETAPDADAIRTLREDEPALLVAAALRLGGYPEIGRLGAFLRDNPPQTSDPDAFSDALLEASLGHLI